MAELARSFPRGGKHSGHHERDLLETRLLDELYDRRQRLFSASDPPADGA
jgi:hypothetical protein